MKAITDALASSVPSSCASRKRFETDCSASSGHGWNQSMTTQLTSDGKRRARTRIGSPAAVASRQAARRHPNDGANHKRRAASYDA